MRLFLIICLFLILSGCTSDSDEVGMSEEKFVAVMTDVYLADAMVSFRIGEDYNDRFQNYGYYKSAFEKHGVSKEDFIKAYDYYSHDIDRFERIIARVTMNISKRADRANQSNQTE